MYSRRGQNSYPKCHEGSRPNYKKFPLESGNFLAFSLEIQYNAYMKWIQFTLSKKQIERAGEILKKNPTEQHSLEILAEFRSAHVYPLNAIQDNLRKKVKEVSWEKQVIISQRLKRIPSILAKIAREKWMDLSRMQDIGWCRAIFSSISEVYGCFNAMRNAKRMSHNPPKRVYDYIESPKTSWYRGIHMVYEFQSNSKSYSQYNGMLIEVQLRTKLQHYWATAVETVGIFTGQALKSSQWNEDWQDFFRLASNWFAMKEWQNLIPDISWEKEQIKKELEVYMKDLKIIETLAWFSHTIKFTEKISQNEGYILLILDTKEHTIQFRRFTEDQIESATDLYANYEQKNQETQDKQIVLFSLASARSLKKAYPNYFGDTTDFMKNLKEIFT